MINEILSNFNLYERNLYKYFQKHKWSFLRNLTINEILRIFYIKLNEMLFHDIYFNYIELPITTKCSLRCKECANLIQYYNEGVFFEHKQMINDIYRLCQVAKGIDTLRILGGEPLLHPYLKEIIIGILRNSNINHVQIVTNGTMLFKRDILSVLRDDRVSVYVSNYGKNSRNYSILTKQLRNNKVRFYTNRELAWTEQGNFLFQNKSENELEQILRKCKEDCISVFNGNIHLCPRSSNGNDLNIFTASKCDYVSLRNINSKRELKKRLYNLLNVRSIVACNYCTIYLQKEMRTCIAGEQISKENAVKRYNQIQCLNRRSL